jgi:hypothetical protein
MRPEAGGAVEEVQQQRRADMKPDSNTHHTPVAPNPPLSPSHEASGIPISRYPTTAVRTVRFP